MKDGTGLNSVEYERCNDTAVLGADRHGKEVDYHPHENFPPKKPFFKFNDII